MLLLVLTSAAFWSSGVAQASGGVSYPPECIAATGEVICARLAANSIGIVQANGYCAQFTNNTAKDYFIPLRTGTERNAFIASLYRLNVDIVACCTSPHCMPGVP